MLQCDGVGGVAERFREDRLLLNREPLYTFAFGIIARKWDAFRIVPENKSPLCEFFMRVFHAS